MKPLARQEAIHQIERRSRPGEGDLGVNWPHHDEATRVFQGRGPYRFWGRLLRVDSTNAGPECAIEMVQAGCQFLLALLGPPGVESATPGGARESRSVQYVDAAVATAGLMYGSAQQGIGRTDIVHDHPDGGT
jgi:hypothetical protein